MKITVSRAIGLILTITGMTLAIWFVQMAALPGPVPLFAFPVAAIAVAMVSVGLRYVFKSTSRDSKSKPPS
ncbi:MAG: hypothetical protein R3C52_08990 [Hyphomonadaceae bacterium]